MLFDKTIGKLWILLKNELKIAFHTQYVQSRLDKGQPVTAVWETNGSVFNYQYETQLLGMPKSQATNLYRGA